MTDRDKLLELLHKAPKGRGRISNYELANYLLANGVIVPPCKVGDYVLWDNGLKDSEPRMLEVKGFWYNPNNWGLRYILEDCQPIINHSCIVGIVPKEEAEEKIKRGKQNEKV